MKKVKFLSKQSRNLDEGVLSTSWIASLTLAMTGNSHSEEESQCRLTRGAAFTKPSRGTNEVRDELQSTKTLSFRCCSERCRLTRGAAFTLAETLITLGVIGIVAALVLPSIVMQYQDKVAVTNVKKAYNIFSNAFAAAQNEYGTANTWYIAQGENANDVWYERLAENLYISKNCGYPGLVYHFCTYANYTSSVRASNSHAAVLNNGMEFATSEFRVTNPKDGLGQKYWGKYGDIPVDINGGKKGPNTLNEDVFRFQFHDITSSWKTNVPPKLYPAGFNTPETSCLNSNVCTAWVLYYENRDYLHCKEKLKATGAHSCKEAK